MRYPLHQPVIFLSTVFAFLLSVATVRAGAPSSATEGVDAVAETYRVLEAFQDTIGRVSGEVLPSVVFIEAVQKINNRKRKVTGSGFIVSDDGVIVTNEHVVDKAQKVEVTLVNDRRKYPATIIGTDQQTDIAVIRIEPEGVLPVPRFGDYADVRVGEGVLAIGNPYGLDGTVSFGIVSAKGRNLNVGSLINDFIQTDAMIDHGSSGGPLVNLRGEIIGVNSMGQGRGIGFTIPINTALEVRDRLLRSGQLERGWLGVTVQPLSRELAEHLGYADVTGVLVTHVIEDSPAARAGIRIEDIITDVDGAAIDTEDANDLNSFRRTVAAIDPGSKVKIGLQRGRKAFERRVTMGEQPKLEGEEFETDYGFTGKEITASMQLANRLDSREGVFVSFVEKDSVAAEAGIMYGEVVVEVGGRSVKTLDDFREALAKLPADGSRFLVKARAGDSLRYHLLIPYGKELRAERR